MVDSTWLSAREFKRRKGYKMNSGEIAMQCHITMVRFSQMILHGFGSSYSPCCET